MIPRLFYVPIVSIGTLFDLSRATFFTLSFEKDFLSFFLPFFFLLQLLDETLQRCFCLEMRNESSKPTVPARLALHRTDRLAATAAALTWVESRGFLGNNSDGPPLMKRLDVVESPSSNKRSIHRRRRRRGRPEKKRVLFWLFHRVICLSTLFAMGGSLFPTEFP